MAKQPFGISPSQEAFIPLPNGLYVAFDHYVSNAAGTSYVRVLNEDGGEVDYWVCDEWEESPIEVMGAIMGAMHGPTPDSIIPKYYKYADDVIFPDDVVLDE